MDRRRAYPVLTFGAALLLAAAADAIPLRAARWLAAGSDPVAALGHEPAECRVDPATDALKRSVMIGRAAFRSPLLLGGQAARAGLSCNACHVNGHDNPDFVFPGLSGAPGTADVTSSLTSRVRGDSCFNPVPIPSLYAPVKIARETPALENFIRALIVDEFDGTLPPAAVQKGLADYVRALDGGCTAIVEVTFESRVADVDAAATAAADALDAGDLATAGVLLLATRRALGDLAERFPQHEFAAESLILRTADRDVTAILELVPADSRAATERLAVWRSQLDGRLRPLAAAASRSLFAHARLKTLRDGR